MMSSARLFQRLRHIGDRLVREVRMRAHLHEARRVLATPPIRPQQDGVVLMSMIGSRVLLPYLVAVKSLHRHLGMGRIVLIDDGSLTDNDKRVLAHHCGSPDIIPIGTIDTGQCPRGGTWERLLTLLDLRAGDYVIQLDSDTVTIGDLPEIRSAIAANADFILLGGEDAEAAGLLPLPDFTARRYPDGPSAPPAHIQRMIESRLASYPDAALHHYVRGCSGFAGFARGGPASRVEATRFSRHAEALVGPAIWSQWGSEQVTSNFLLANEPGVRLLPYARYTNYWRQKASGDERFVHFIGTYRYSGPSYRRLTAQAIDRLLAG
ncbi:glycosyltransferase family 2 protein [Sphingomonas sanguinis]|uniref:glycosyltransferase family A protein n=1 Tax=Sphingomonas sp. LC-1 TaxID=3110957 RepID=UPI0021BAC7B0|nr:glycosyltransferase family A protein [Sphingomonas sp. LC-1]MCT8002574.1 glycosyltransferase family 2 protein [Sphingomonas sp. LC-1]